jgi:pimeloyl-ACP methyl ester carboxylesterase
MITLALVGLGALEAKARDIPPAPFSVRVIGTGKPIIFIPGLACSGDVWNDTVDHLSKKYQCHVLTLAGFAGQPPVEGPFLERNKKSIAEYIRAEKLDKPAIVGHSIGGYMTFLLGVAEPDLVGPLVSIDGVPCLPALMNPGVTAEQLKALGEQWSKMIASQGREEYMKHQERTLSNWLPDAAKRKQVLAWGAASDQKTVATAMGELMSSDLRQEVSKIKSRTLLIAAPAPFEGFTKEELQKRYSSQVDRIPNGKVVFAEKSRHFIMYDEPEWMREQIEKFLAEGK